MPGREPFDTWLQTRGTAYDLVMTTEADADSLLADATGAVRDSSTVLYPQPVATADVVLTPVAGGRDPSDLEPDLRDALADRGYRVEGADVPAGAPALGPTDGLPSAGAARRAPGPVGRSRAMSTARAFRRRRTLIGALLALALIGAACSSGDDDTSTGSGADEIADPGDCTSVDMAVSSEKIALMTDLANGVQRLGRSRGRRRRACSSAPQIKASGAATHAARRRLGRAASNGPRPVDLVAGVERWGAILNQRLAEKGEPAMAPPAEPFMLTPLVIAMPKPMADALGYPRHADRLRRHPRASPNDPQGWAAYGHPEWGPFRLGKTNPNFSTSGLSALDRPVLRGHRQDDRTCRSRTSTTAGPCAFATRRRVGRRPLRRHHDDVPQQLVPHRPRAARRSPTSRRWPSRRSR